MLVALFDALALGAIGWASEQQTCVARVPRVVAIAMVVSVLKIHCFIGLFSFSAIIPR